LHISNAADAEQNSLFQGMSKDIRTTHSLIDAQLVFLSNNQKCCKKTRILWTVIISLKDFVLTDRIVCSLKYKLKAT